MIQTDPSKRLIEFSKGVFFLGKESPRTATIITYSFSWLYLVRYGRPQLNIKQEETGYQVNGIKSEDWKCHYNQSRPTN